MQTKRTCAAPLHCCFSLQLLKGVTIASGGVLPRIQPELLAKKRGAKGKSETILSPAPEKKGRKSVVNKKSGKKAKTSKARTPKKVSVKHMWDSRGVREGLDQNQLRLLGGTNECICIV